MPLKYDNENIFAKILRNEAPCIKVYEDADTLAMMDIMPQTEGHTLVISKHAALTLYDLPEESAAACIKTVQKVGKAIEKAMGVEGSSVFQLNGSSAGQTVHHIHFHIVPGALSELEGHATQMGDPEKLQKTAKKIIQQL